MRSLTVISALMLLVLSVACTSTGDDVTSPAFPNLLDEEKNSDSFAHECHENMRTIAGACCVYLASNGTYPADLNTLGEPYTEMTCPECGLPYELKGDEKNFALNCPLPEIPNHGSVINGIVSWPPDPEEEEDYCRSNMRVIFCQAVIFSGTNGRYPRDLEEFGMEDVVCPTCGLTYEYIGVDTVLYVGCPIPADPNHGFIDTNGTSWHAED